MIVIFDKWTWVCTVIIDHSAYFNFKSYCILLCYSRLLGGEEYQEIAL